MVRARKREGQKLKRLTCVPDFDRLVLGARYDRFSIWGEGNGADAGVVRVLFRRLELEST